MYVPSGLLQVEGLAPRGSFRGGRQDLGAAEARFVRGLPRTRYPHGHHAQRSGGKIEGGTEKVSVENNGS